VLWHSSTAASSSPASSATVEEGVRGGTTDLWELTQEANRRVGPYPEFMTELGASVRAHMAVPGVPAAPGR
jgi:hypothetical protein